MIENAIACHDVSVWFHPTGILRQRLLWSHMNKKVHLISPAFSYNGQHCVSISTHCKEPFQNKLPFSRVKTASLLRSAVPEGYTLRHVALAERALRDQCVLGHSRPPAVCFNDLYASTLNITSRDDLVGYLKCYCWVALFFAGTTKSDGRDQPASQHGSI